MRNCIGGVALATVAMILQANGLAAQEPDLKQKAQAAFKAENYSEAITFLKQAIVQKPDDAEAYYYLGYFTHYLCYDSMPLVGYGEANSDEVLTYLRKAVSLDPKLGNAFYFIGAEYGARFLRQMRAGNLDGMIRELRKGREEGGLPDWLVEYNRNMLRSCDPNAILFTGGDPEADSAWYLQYVESFRRDVTVIPVAALQWPWYILTLSERPDLVTAPVPTGWSKEQILEMHPYKWKANQVAIPVSEPVRRGYSLPDSVRRMDWLVEPDLLEGERSYLSPRMTAMVAIIKSNAWKRPIHFSLGVTTAWQKGLTDNLQLCGTTNRLLPVKLGKGIPPLEEKKTREILLDLANFRDIGNVREKDYSRNSGILSNYLWSYRLLMKHLIEKTPNADFADARAILATMNKVLPESILPRRPGLFADIEARLGQTR